MTLPWAAAIGGPVLLVGGAVYWWRSRAKAVDVERSSSSTGGSGGRPVLRRGSTGSEVAEVQAQLGATVDGVFGPNTEARVKEFQLQSGLTADGIVGPATWAALAAKPAPGLVMGDAERRRALEA